MKKHFPKISLFFIALWSWLFTFGQPFNNSWINYNQQFFEFKIAETGIYRIDSATLFNAGIPLSSINPQNFQLYARGQEVAIFIEGENDGVFNQNDYIEFYAEHNDGWLDEQLYGSATNHPNPYYSLTTDTITYFLTWNNATNNLRFQVETDTNFSAYSPVTHFIKENVQFFTAGNGTTNPYYDGETMNIGGQGVSLFGYSPTEGWFDLPYNVGGSTTKNINSQFVYTSGSPAKLKAVILGQSDFSSSAANNQHLRIEVAGQQFDTLFKGYQKIDVEMSLPLNNLGNNTTGVTFTSVNDLGASVARQAVANVLLHYPHLPNMENLPVFDNFFLQDHPIQSKSYLRFSNFNSSGEVLFYDLTNNKKIKVVQDSGFFKCLIPNNNNQKELYLSSDGQVNNVGNIQPVNGSGFFTDYAANPIDTAFLIITHQSLLSAANDYANYRQNPGFSVQPQNAVVFTVEEIYRQFAFGVEKHPIAIRNFLDYLLNTWPTKPNYLFLLGKSIKSKEIRKSPINFQNCLVPSYGEPASDNMITAGLGAQLFSPAIPTGRLAAKNTTEVLWYLNKVQQHENPMLGNNGETEWMKQVLHFAGGLTASEQNSFQTYLGIYENIIEDTLFGGNVKTFTKTTTAPIHITLSDSIKSLIGNGIAMMTFFGHASATGGFDQSIDDPHLWPNQQGRYPFLTGLACFAGDIHLSGANSTSEEHVILDNKGVIGFLSSVDLATSFALHNFSKELHENISYKNYGRSIGQLIQATTANTTFSTGSSVKNFNNSTALNMTYHGDPAIHLHTFEKPDYMINQASVSFNPGVITSALDSFEVNIVVTNLGKAIDTTIILSLTRDYPNANFSDTTYLMNIDAPMYKDTFMFKLPVDVVRGMGLNNFTIMVDAPPLSIDEIDENNNIIIKQLNIRSDNILPIYPYEFSIVPNQGITLVASTAFPFQPAADYVFEVDTTDYFNSPIKERTTITAQPGGIITWTPNLLQNMPDSMVYFWRVSKDSSATNSYNWQMRSFQYIQNKEGWQQQHIFQFENNPFQLVGYSRPNRLFSFQNKVATAKVITDGAIGSTTVNGPTNWSEGSIPSYYIDQSRMAGNGWGANAALHVAILDTISFDYWKPLEMNMGQANIPGMSPNSVPSKFFVFRNGDPAQMNALANMLQDSVPNGYYVLMWTWYWNMFWGYSPLPANLNNVLTNLGATQIANAQDSLPFAMIVKKGIPTSVVENVGNSVTEKGITVSKTIIGSANFGNVFSPPLGPAVSWDSLSWRMMPLENPSKDSTVLNVFGIDQNGNETLLISNLPTDSGDIRIINQINANTYPYLRLNAHITDDSLFTAPQLHRWQITYEDIPEAAIAPNIHFTFYNDTVQEGENIRLSIAVKNISRHNMDSLLIAFKVLNKYNQLLPINYPRQRPLLADSVMIVNLEFSTRGMAGINSLLMEVNPNNDQLEKYHFNNLAEIPFYVMDDKINPLLDVTFDGVHILDGDIVSPKPQIVVELKDENLFLALNDTSDFAVWVTDPTGVEKRIYFYENGIEKMQFIPASLPKNSAKIIFPAYFDKDGLHKLRVQANDISKNESGSNDYLISFEVIHKSTITNIVNYPNPFTTSTRFVFTLTGSQVPDIFKIQIMTITGKVVREIHKEELGNIRIGRNITDFAWDGTDQYGDRLANGLYLYRVVTKINNNDIEHRSTNADNFFKKGYGKMYLFR